MHRINHIITAALLALVVSACSDDGDKYSSDGKGEAKTVKLSQPRAGQCIGGEVPDGEDFGPDTQKVVPCSEAHVYEIAAVVAIPDDMLAGGTDAEMLARRTELADISDTQSELRTRLDKEVYSLCNEPFQDANGLAGLTVLGKTAKEAGLRMPYGDASEWRNLTSPELWVDGTAQAVCSYRFGPPTTEAGVVSSATPVRSTNTLPIMASYTTKKYPVELRPCTATESSENIPCTAAHSQEPLWIIDMKAVYGKDFLTGADLTDVNDDQFNKMQQACLDPFQQVGGHLNQTRRMGFRFFSNVPTTGTSLPIICLVSSADGSRLGDTFVAFDF